MNEPTQTTRDFAVNVARMEFIYLTMQQSLKSIAEFKRRIEQLEKSHQRMREELGTAMMGAVCQDRITFGTRLKVTDRFIPGKPKIFEGVVTRAWAESPTSNLRLYIRCDDGRVTFFPVNSPVYLIEIIDAAAHSPDNNEEE